MYNPPPRTHTNIFLILQQQTDVSSIYILIAWYKGPHYYIELCRVPKQMKIFPKVVLYEQVFQSRRLYYVRFLLFSFIKLVQGDHQRSIVRTIHDIAIANISFRY